MNYLKLQSCAVDLDMIKSNYQQSEWLTLGQALEYVPDMKERWTADQLLQLMKLREAGLIGK